MLTIFKWIAGFLLTLALVLIAAAFVVPRVFDSDQVRDTLVNLVEKQTGRVLAIQGELSYSAFPWLGLQVQEVRFAQPAQIGDADGPMLQVSSAQLRVKLPCSANAWKWILWCCSSRKFA